MPAADPTRRELTFWKIDECAAYFDRLHLCGWCHVPGETIERIEIVFGQDACVRALSSFGLPSPDVARVCGPGAAAVRFDEWVPVPPEVLGTNFSLRCRVADGRWFVGTDALTNAAWGDPYFQIWENFISMLDRFAAGTVLEIGSRARSAITRRHRIPRHLSYVGLDILPGPNVDIVGDAHELSRVFPQQRFVAVFSASVFEHLAMPWKVAVEINRVLDPGGIVYTASHQSWPMHEEPWDFWRFSRHAWRCLFNAATGFEIVEAVVGEPARIHPCRTESVTRGLPESRAYLGSAAVARKLCETELHWPVPLADAAADTYPAGELDVAPTRNPT
jgi:hypothetical protein